MIRLFLLRFFESYFRHRWLYLLPIVVTIAAAAVYFLTLEPKYSARGILYVNNESLLNSLNAVQNNDTSWWITPAQATSNELNELFHTDAFIRAVISETDLESAMDLGPEQVVESLTAVRESMWIQPLGNNQLLITASYEDPLIAYQLVHSVIDSYLQWQVNTQRIDSEVARGFFTDLIETYSADLEAAHEKMKAYLDAHPQPVRGDRPDSELVEIDRLQNEIDLASSRYMNALNKEENAKLAWTQVESDVNQTYVLLDAPSMPEKPEISKRKLALQAAIFVAAGVVISIIGITGSALLDRSFRFPMDVESRLNLPVLAGIPDLTPRAERERRFLPALSRRKKAVPEQEIHHPVPKATMIAHDRITE